MNELEGHNGRTRPPDFLRVEEAAKVLRIGRTTAYALASEFLDTNGASGLPVVRLGKQLRVPRSRLEAMLGGTITWPPGRNGDGTQPAPPVPTASSIPRHSQRRRTGSRTQPVLSFPS
jgi:excisionase family DNA binding protein